MSIRFRLNRIAILISAVAAVFFMLGPVQARMYKWTDEHGKIHYTDSASKIPKKYRKQGQGGVKTLRGSPGGGSAGGGTYGSGGGQASRLPKNGIEVPLIPTGGGNQAVMVNLNGNSEATLMVDTGASMVVVHPSMARSLGIHKLDDQPRMPFSTAGGQEWSPVAVLDTVKVGEAVIPDVEVSFNKHMPPNGGLLGMTFLGEFRMEMDRNQQLMFLRPLNPNNDPVYGDRPLYWWKNKFKEYLTGLNRSDYSRQHASSRMEKAEYQKLVLYYQNLVDRLNRRADAARLPDAPRHPFGKP